MIILHFYLPPQFTYKLFHIYFTSEIYVYLFSFSDTQAQCEGNGCVAAVAGPHLGVRVYGGGQEYHLFPLYFRHCQLVAGILFQILLCRVQRSVNLPFPFFQSAGGFKEALSNNSCCVYHSIHCGF